MTIMMIITRRIRRLMTRMMMMMMINTSTTIVQQQQQHRTKRPPHRPTTSGILVVLFICSIGATVYCWGKNLHSLYGLLRDETTTVPVDGVSSIRLMSSSSSSSSSTVSSNLWALIDSGVPIIINESKSASLSGTTTIASPTTPTRKITSSRTDPTMKKNHLASPSSLSSINSVNSTTTESTTTSRTKTKTKTKTNFGACLLVMDDNHLLIEWLAYHYHAVNLRTVIVAIDPKSITSPVPTLDRYNNITVNNYSHHLMDIIIWDDDDDYMTQKEFDTSQKYIRKFHSSPAVSSTNTTTTTTTTATTTTTTIGETLVQHRARQRVFYTKCLQTLKRRQLAVEAEAAAIATKKTTTTSIDASLSSYSSNLPGSRTTVGWTIDYVMLIDTDEFLSIHDGPLLKKKKKKRQRLSGSSGEDTISTTTRTIAAADDDDDVITSSSYSLRRPGVIADLLASELDYGSVTDDTRTNNNISNTPTNNNISSNSENIATNKNDDDGSSLMMMTRRPLMNSWKQASPCIQIPRLRYSSKESTPLQVQKDVPELFNNSSSHFMTLRYRWHARLDDMKQNRISKAIIDLKRVPLSVLLNERTMLSSIHVPLPGGTCTKPGLKISPNDSLLVIHHYLGSYEQYVYGRTNDARNSDVIVNARTKEQFQRIQQEMLKPQSESDTIRPWLDGFLHETVPLMVRVQDTPTTMSSTAVVLGDEKGLTDAVTTMSGSGHGVTTEDDIVSQLALALLKDVGVLRGKETTGTHVDDNNEDSNNKDGSLIPPPDLNGGSTSTNDAVPNTTAATFVDDFDVDHEDRNGSVVALLTQRRRERGRRQNDPPKILVFITTIYSMNHIKYFTCCWPHLMKDSQLLKQASIMIFSNNETIVPQAHLDIARRNFQMTHENNNINNTDDGPTLSFLFASPDEIATTKPSFNNGSATRNLPDDQLAEYGFQKGANLGLELGFRKGWFDPYDWIVRINPDVLIRNSTWLLQTMSDPDVDGIFVRCGTEEVFQLHTDFFAVRPGRVTELWAGEHQQQGRPSSIPFSDMVTYPSGTKRHLINHELTASKYFEPIVNESRHRYLPDADPSYKKCRVRGPHSSVYHQHDSVGQCNDKNKVCGALVGWKIT